MNKLNLYLKLIAGFGVIVFGVFYIFKIHKLYEEKSKIKAVESAIKRAGDYMKKSVKKNGMFVYCINMDSSIPVNESYNILRHAGAIFSMVDYYNLHPDKEMLKAIERAGKYLQNNAIHPLKSQKDLLAVWSDPEVNKSDDPINAKLGGSGLGIVALLSIEKIHPDFTPISEIQKLGKFIIYMQKKDGSFYSKYIPSLEGPTDKWKSLYYPGEAALGLLMLYEKDGAEVWFESALKALLYLAAVRKNKTDVPADHWALLATEKILELDNKILLPETKEILVKHAIQISNSILKTQIKENKYSEFIGGFNEKGFTTPTATRLEGLQAVRSFLPDSHEMSKQIDIAVELGISFLLRSQKTAGQFSGAFPRGICKSKENIQFINTFNQRVTEVQIDYVQHAMSAMIQYLNTLYSIR